MALAFVLNLVFCIAIVLAIVSLLAWAIRASRGDERLHAARAVRARQPRPSHGRAQRARFGESIRPTA